MGSTNDPGTRPLNANELNAAAKASDKCLLLLDYDGTLAPFTRIPRKCVRDAVQARFTFQICKRYLTMSLTFAVLLLGCRSDFAT